MTGALVRRGAACAVAAGLVFLVAGCGSQVPEASPLPTLMAGTWVSSDGKYSITLDEDPDLMHMVMPFEDYGTGGPGCSASGDYPPAVTIDGRWSVWDGSDTLHLEIGDLDYGVGPAREGDWSVIEDYPCGPDHDPLYLVRQD
jgi:hypothetical protein